MDHYEQLRYRMIDIMQLSLKRIRLLLDIGVLELAELLGVSRQSINNFENSKTQMSSVQYLAICAVLDTYTAQRPEIMPVIKGILNSNDTFYEDRVFEEIPNNSLISKWFSCFPSNIKANKSDLAFTSDLAENHKIFLDDTVLCTMADLGQMSELIIAMKQKGRKFIVPMKVIDSIQMRLFKNTDVFANIDNGLNNIKKLQNEGVLELRGEPGDITIISTLMSVFMRYKSVYRLTLITQNRRLAESMLTLNHDGIGGFEIQVLYLTADGEFKKWEDYSREKDYTYVQASADHKENDTELIPGWENI